MHLAHSTRECALCVFNALTSASRWFGRAWMRDALDRPYLRGNDEGKDSYSYIDLESQPWGLLLNHSELPMSSRDVLFDNVNQQLQQGSPIGPRLQPETGLVWPAITHLLTWAYAGMLQRCKGEWKAGREG